MEVDRCFRTNEANIYQAHYWKSNPNNKFEGLFIFLLEINYATNKCFKYLRILQAQILLDGERAGEGELAQLQPSPF